MRRKHWGAYWRRSTVTGRVHVFMVGDEMSACAATSTAVSTIEAERPAQGLCRACVGIDVALRAYDDNAKDYRFKNGRAYGKAAS